MGQQTRCLAAFGGQVSEGTAQLETDELRFRGTFRLVIPLMEVQGAVAQDGRLAVTFPGGVATFDLGVRAAKWADKILRPPTLFDKLGVKPGQRVRLRGIADQDFRRGLADQGVAVTEDGPSDLLFFGADGPVDLLAVGTLREALAPEGALWIVYPKGRKDVREADVLAAGRAAGLYDVKVARFSETHTALKFVVPVAHRRPTSHVARPTAHGPGQDRPRRAGP